jgi:hypothetical protein
VAKIQFQEPDEKRISIKAYEVLPEDLQTRARTDPEIVAHYAEAMVKHEDAFPPVTLYSLPDKRLVLADGFHRHAARVKLGARDIKAIVREGTLTDAILCGIRMNQDPKNIRKVEEEDRAKAAESLIRNPDTRDFSDNAIARLVGMSQTGVRKIRLRLAGDGIGLPERIRSCDAQGRPSASTRPYRNQQHGRAITSFDGKFYASIDGKQIHLGNSPESAKRRLSHQLQRIQQNRRTLRSGSVFGQWATTRMIFADSLGQHAFATRDSLVALVGDETPAAVFGAIGRLAWAESQCGPKSRRVAIYYRLDPVASRIRNDLANMGHPIEFMTLDEFYVAFRSTQDRATGTVASDAVA